MEKLVLYKKTRVVYKPIKASKQLFNTRQECVHFGNFSVSSDAPSSPGMVRLSAIKSRSLEITWSRPHDGNSPILNYIIEYSNLPGKFSSLLEALSSAQLR